MPGIRAALAWNIETAKLARQHNDAQIVAIGARQHSLDEAAELAAAFVAEPFSEDPRHQRRIDELAKYEKTHEPPALPEPEPMPEGHTLHRLARRHRTPVRGQAGVGRPARRAASPRAPRSSTG